MYKIVSFFIFFIFSSSVFSVENLPYIDSRDLNKVERLQLISSYKSFLISLENKESVEESKLYSTIIFEKLTHHLVAYANGLNDCIYGGWPSRRMSSGFCNRPETSPEYERFQTLAEEFGFEENNPKGYQKCAQDERQCNPIIFGPVCVPFDTKYNRVRATSNCDRQSRSVFPSGFDYKSYIEENLETEKAEKLGNIFDEQLDNLQETANTVCLDQNKKQSRTAVCRVLEERLGADFPYHKSSRNSGGSGRYSGTSSKSKSSNPLLNTPTREVSEKGLKELENDIGALNIEIDKTLGSDECTDPSVAVVTNKRYNTIRLMDPKSGEFLSEEGSKCIQKLKPLLDRRSKLLGEYQRTLNELTPNAGACTQEDLLQDQNEIAKQITDMNKIVAEKACDKNPQKWTAMGCAGDFACAIGSSLFYGGALDKVGAWVGEKLGFSKDCLNSQNNCAMKIATAAADVVWSFLQSIPDIASAAWDGVKWVGKEVYSWMPWVSDTEEKLSDANQAAMNVMEEDEESTLTKIGNFFSEMWQMLQDYITDDLMCTEEGWELERFKKDAHCDAPFVSWNCLTCAGAISSVCNIVGAVGSEVIIGILTGGGATAAKAGTRALSVGIKAGTRMALKSQMKGILGTTLKTSVKVGAKVVRYSKVPFTLAKSTLGKSKVFLKNQTLKYAKAQSWVTRNANKVLTPIIPKNRVVRNITEMSVEGTKKIIKNSGEFVKKTAMLPFKLPGKALKVTGRILDPFKLGEKGFALGYKAANGLIPGVHFLRITNFSYDLLNTAENLTKATKASKAVDISMNLMTTANKQMDEWLRLAKAGKLTQEEFNQMQKVLALNDEIRKIENISPNQLKRLDDIEREFLKNKKTLESIIGESGIARYNKYNDKVYGNLDKNKVRNAKTGKELSFDSAQVLKKNSDEVVITLKPKNEEFLVVDEIDGQYIAINSNGDEVIISSGSFSSDSNKFLVSQLNNKSMGARFENTKGISSKGGKKKVAQKIASIKSLEDIKPQSTLKKAQTTAVKKVEKVVSPVTNKYNKVSLKSTISSGKNNNNFITNTSKQKELIDEVDSYQKIIINKVKAIKNEKDLAGIAEEIKILDSAKDVASPANKLKIDNYKREIYSQLDNNKLKSKLANQVRGPANDIKFKTKTDNIAIKGADNKAIDSYKAKLTGTVDDSGAYIRIDKNNLSEGVRIIDESKTSFIGHDSRGRVLHIKKTAVPEEMRKTISQSVSELSPKSKDKIIQSLDTKKGLRVYPKTDPDFIYSKQLAKSEIRVGDDIVKLRRMQAASENLKTNLVDGGAVVVKNTKGEAIKINNIHESGKYWIGFSVPDGKRVLMPKHLLDSKMNNLMSRGRNFTKFKRNIKKNLSFIKKFNKKTGAIEVDKALKLQYKYANYSIKYRMTRRAIEEMDQSTLEKINENVYLRRLSESEAEILYAEPTPLSEEEQALMDNALEEAVADETEYDFDDFDESDFDF